MTLFASKFESMLRRVSLEVERLAGKSDMNLTLAGIKCSRARYADEIESTREDFFIAPC